jgi:hypothetical protein
MLMKTRPGDRMFAGRSGRHIRCEFPARPSGAHYGTTREDSGALFVSMAQLTMSSFRIIRRCATAAVAVVVSLLLGCAHSTVRELGDGRHMLTAVASSGGYAGSHEEAVERANDFCRYSRAAAGVPGPGR